MGTAPRLNTSQSCSCDPPWTLVSVVSPVIQLRLLWFGAHFDLRWTGGYITLVLSSDFPYDSDSLPGKTLHSSLVWHRCWDDLPIETWICIEPIFFWNLLMSQPVAVREDGEVSSLESTWVFWLVERWAANSLKHAMLEPTWMGWQSTMGSSSGREFGGSASSGVDKESFSRLYRSRDSGRNLWVTCWSSVAQLCLTLWPHGLQHARPPCPSPSPRVFANSYPLSQWCHPTISSSVVPFSSCPQSFPASGSFPMTSYLPLLSKEQASDQTPRLLPRVQLGHFDDVLIFKPEGPLGMLSGRGWQSWV